MKESSRKLIEKEYSHLTSIYFNSAYFGPNPHRIRQAALEAIDHTIDPSFYPYETWMGIPEKIRGLWARILAPQISADHIALATGVGQIMNSVANGLTLQKDDVVVLMDGDYPSVILPWLVAKEQLGFEIQFLRNPLPDADWLKTHLPKKTKVFATSHVSFNTGRKIDLLSIGKLMKEWGIYFVVDATQSLGGMFIDSLELATIDVLAVAGYKWMLGPYGQGFGYFSDRALKNISHKFGNWITSPNSSNSNDLLDYTTETLPGARKFDRAQSPNMLINACLEKSLSFLLELDRHEITQHNASLRDHFLDNYPKNRYQLATPQDGLSNILCLKPQGDAVALKKALEKKEIDVSVREGNLRISFHLFNKITQVDKLLAAL